MLYLDIGEVCLEYVWTWVATEEEHQFCLFQVVWGETFLWCTAKDWMIVLIIVLDASSDWINMKDWRNKFENQFVNVNKEKRGTCPSSMGKHLWFASLVESVFRADSIKDHFWWVTRGIDICWPWVYLMTQLSYLFINSCAETDCRGGTKGLFDCTGSSA